MLEGRVISSSQVIGRGPDTCLANQILWKFCQNRGTFTEGHWEPKSYKLDRCGEATFGLMPGKVEIAGCT